MAKITAEQVYDRLLNLDKILEQRGQIRFFLGDVSIVVRQRDVVGSIMQEWLEGWLRKNNYDYLPNPNTQMPPDIYLDTDNIEENLLEVKAFNYLASPGFDIADFRAFQEEIIEKPYMLHVKYLIFGYSMTEDGIVTICGIWLKNVWEICRAMSNYPLNLQVKDNVIHKIRPAKWYGSSSNYPPFECLEDFVSAIDETVFRNPKTRDISGTWCSRFVDAYRQRYGRTLQIHRWNEIKDRYVRQ